MGDTTYLAADAKLPYCRGCGHALVVRQLSRALEGLALPARSIVLTTDIGCVGLADSLFPYVHTVHTTHGRSTAMAIGMALAEAVVPASGLKPIVMIGDGGAMIGLLHLVHAAQLNVDITVLVHNNFLFGMTGSQHSAFTPLDWSTTTTPDGNRVPPLDLLALLRAAHAGSLARQFATDGNLNAVIADAIAYPGFSLVEILEICTGYGGLMNKSKGAALHEFAGRQGYAIGQLEAKQPRPSFTQLCRHEIDSKTAPLLVEEGPGVVDPHTDAATHHPLTPPPVEDGSRLSARDESRSAPLEHPGAADSRLKIQDSKPMHVVIAGAAGERVQSSAALLCRAALSAGLYTTQKNDNPVTQGSGFSLSEICLGPRPIQYTGMESADVVIAVSQEGWNELTTNGTLSALTPGSLLVLDSEIETESPAGRVLRQPFRRDATPKRAALAAIAFWLGKDRVIPNATWQSVVAALPVERRADVAEALRIGSNLASQGGER
jgi:pyruvate/2-oxoacid:ferredoxin oxidoreductase beta subunit/Pyruvate/2-oxoacid:ferredoxin oxidoreductase gamma subunit